MISTTTVVMRTSQAFFGQRRVNPAHTNLCGDYAFCVTLIGNADKRLKNWSLIYPDRKSVRNYRPSTIWLPQPSHSLPEDKLALSFGFTRRLAEISADQMRRFAETALLPVSPLWRMIMEVVDRTVKVWKVPRKRRNCYPLRCGRKLTSKSSKIL